MKAIILGGLLLTTGVAMAALKLERKVEPVYITVASGKQVSSIEAVQASMRGEAILECNQVEAVGAKSSIKLKKIK